MTVAALPSRRVLRLALRAPTAELAHHASVALADALHTATIPAADQGRLVVIRRLALGRIDPRASSMSLALRIEEVARFVVALAEPADSPRAATAEAVAFRDSAEAVIMLARRAARRQSVHEWYWQAAFPAWKPGRSGASLWQSILELAHDQPAPLSTVAAVVREALNAGVDITEGLTVTLVRGWLWRLGLDPSALPARHKPELRQIPAPDQRISRVVESGLETWGAQDARSFWVAAIALFIARPSLAATSGFSATVQVWLRHREESTYVKVAHDTGAKGSLRHPIATAPGPMVDDRATPVSAPVTDEATSPIARVQERTVSETAIPGSDQDDEPLPMPAIPPGGAWSGYAGLLFLVPIMERLDMREFLEQNPALAEANFPALFMRDVGERVGMPASDPLALALTVEIAEIAWPPRFQLTPSLELLLSETRPHGVIRSAYDIWLMAVRHWCRRKARMGLITLIHRTGLILASRTHLDICFAPDQADVRLRRQALDVNPGWVPWLGRVIRFHYGDRNHG